jgi:hypothetical protein
MARRIRKLSSSVSSVVSKNRNVSASGRSRRATSAAAVVTRGDPATSGPCSARRSAEKTYVPEFPEKQWPVTLSQSMAHVAGVRSDGGDEGPLFSVRCERPVDALQ